MAELDGALDEGIGPLPGHEVPAAVQATRTEVVREHGRRHQVEVRVQDVVGRAEQQQGADCLVAREQRRLGTMAISSNP